MNSVSTRLTAKEKDWDEAFLRVESYLRALHVESRVLLNRLVTEILTEAKGIFLTSAAEHPVKLAMAVAQNRLDRWFAGVAESTGKSEEKFHLRGRLALIMADQQGEWAHYFVSGEQPPLALATAMTSAVLQSGPEVRFSNMPPAPLEFETEEDRKNIQPAMRWVIARAAGVWVSIIALMGMAWAASH